MGKYKMAEVTRFKVGDNVKVDKDKFGVVYFVSDGKTEKIAKLLGNSYIYGVFLTEKRGTCSGMSDGVEFFKCKEGHGIFVKQSRIASATEKEVGTFVQEYEAAKLKAAQEIEAKMAKNAIKDDILRAEFSKIDTNKSGAISKKEFRAAYKNTHKNLTDEQVEKEAMELFKKINITGGLKGTISLAEYDLYRQKLAEEKEKNGKVNKN